MKKSEIILEIDEIHLVYFIRGRNELVFWDVASGFCE
jgi:hypothetical protein